MSESQAPESSDDMAEADLVNGERPEQPVSAEHSRYERRRAAEDDRTGEDQLADDEV
jgi:hypothetical protein